MEFDNTNDRIEEVDHISGDFKKILVVDDILYVVRSIARILREEGYFVITATSGGEALEKIEKYSPSLITIDHNLPDMTGIDLIHSIRKINRDSSLKIVYISAVHDRSIIKSVINIGIDHYLIKPFKKTKLVELVNKFIGI